MLIIMDEFIQSFILTLNGLLLVDDEIDLRLIGPNIEFPKEKN